MRIRRRRTRPIVLKSGKFSEPIANTPRSITVLTQEVLRDKDATSLKEVGRTTPGVTIGTGEGGNAFGDRFFIRGFDARNDVFVDGIRDPAVNIRENFFTEQIEILKGPSSTINGRGTAGGAINIVTKQATTEASFYNADFEIRQRQHQACHLRRQPGHHADARRPHGRHVAERQYLRARLSRPTIAGAAWRR